MKFCHNCASLNVKKEKNSIVYGRVYGNGICYYCHDCKASVGTHDNGKPLGTLASKDVQILRKACHDIFDKVWKYERKKSRSELYRILAEKMNITKKECHFAMFQRIDCLTALEIITERDWYKK